MTEARNELFLSWFVENCCRIAFVVYRQIVSQCFRHARCDQCFHATNWPAGFHAKANISQTDLPPNKISFTWLLRRCYSSTHVDTAWRNSSWTAKHQQARRDRAVCSHGQAACTERIGRKEACERSSNCSLMTAKSTKIRLPLRKNDIRCDRCNAALPTVQLLFTYNIAWQRFHHHAVHNVTRDSCWPVATF